MDEVLQMLASIGLGNVSPAQVASVFGPEKMATLEQAHSLRPLRAQTPSTISSQGKMLDQDTESFIRSRKQHIKHAKEVLEASGRALPAPKC